MYPWMKKKKIKMLVSFLKFMKIFFIQIYIKFAETKFDQTIKLVTMINLKWLQAYIYWCYNISDNKCPFLKMICNVVGLLT